MLGPRRGLLISFVQLDDVWEGDSAAAAIYQSILLLRIIAKGGIGGSYSSIQAFTNKYFLIEPWAQLWQHRKK